MNSRLLLASTGMAFIGLALAGVGYLIRSRKGFYYIHGFSPQTSPDPQALALLAGLTLYRLSGGCLVVAVLTSLSLPYRGLVRGAFIVWSFAAVLLFAVGVYRVARERVSKLVADLMERLGGSPPSG